MLIKPYRSETALDILHPLARDLIVDLPFWDGGGSKVSDTTPNKLHGINNGGIWNGDSLGNALELNGTTDNITIPDSSIFEGKEFTWWIWARFDTWSNGDNSWFMKGDFSPLTNWSFAIQQEFNGGTLREVQIFVAQSGSDNGSNHYITSSPTDFFPVGKLLNITVVYNGNLAAADRIKIFCDGRELGGSVTGTIATSIKNVSDNLYIGEFNGLGRNFGGKISKARIYKRALIPEEVDKLSYNPDCIYEV